MATANGIFTGFSVSEVLQIREAAKKSLLQGKTIMQYSDGTGVSVSKDWPIDPQTILQECNYALKVLDPTTYGSPKSTRRKHANFSALSGL